MAGNTGAESSLCVAGSRSGTCLSSPHPRLDCSSGGICSHPCSRLQSWADADHQKCLAHYSPVLVNGKSLSEWEKKKKLREVGFHSDKLTKTSKQVLQRAFWSFFKRYLGRESHCTSRKFWFLSLLSPMFHILVKLIYKMRLEIY